MLYRLSVAFALLATGLTASGCASAVSAGHNTALSGVDLVRMTDQMAASLAADPDVQKAYAEGGPLKVVVKPVENMMTAKVLPRGAREAFTARVRTLLSKHAPDRYTWVMERDAWYRLRDKELEGVDPGPAPDAISPQYVLRARFQSLTDETKDRRSSYYLAVYELTDLEERTVLWTDKYEVKKSAAKAFLD